VCVGGQRKGCQSINSRFFLQPFGFLSARAWIVELPTRLGRGLAWLEEAIKLEACTEASSVEMRPPLPFLDGFECAVCAG